MPKNWVEFSLGVTVAIFAHAGVWSVKIFISYSRKDLERITPILHLFKANGLDAWLDHDRLVPGVEWETAIQAAIGASDALVFFMSPYSVKSRHCLDELHKAYEHGVRMVPVLLSTCEVPMRIARLQRIDLSKDHTASVHALLQCLGASATSQSEAPPHTESAQESSLRRLSATKASFKGFPADLRQGSPLLFTQQGLLSPLDSWDARIASSVSHDPSHACTHVEWSMPLSPVSLVRNSGVYCFQVRAGIFGSDARDWHTLPHEERLNLRPHSGASCDEWPDFELTNGKPLSLDCEVPQLVTGSYALLFDERWEATAVRRVKSVSRTGFGIVRRVTQFDVSSDVELPMFHRRETLVYLVSQSLAVVDGDASPFARAQTLDAMPST